MSRYASYLEHCFAGIESLEHYFPFLAAVDSICKIHGKPAEIHRFGPSEACFFVGYEGDVNLAVFHIRILLQVLQSHHQVGYCSLVIRAEDRCSVAYDDILSDVGSEFRMLLLADVYLLFLILKDVPSLIVPYDPGMYLSRELDVHGVHVAAPSCLGNRLMSFFKSFGEPAVDDSGLADEDVLYVQFLKIFRQGPCHDPLPFR